MPASELLEPAVRVAVGADHADSQVRVHVVREASGGHVRPGHAVGLPGLHVQGSDSPRAVPAHDLQSRRDRDDQVSVKADGSRIEGNEAVLEIQAEVEKVCPVGEERSLLGKEEGEPGDVHLKGVRLDLGEIGIDGEHSVELRAQVIPDVEAGLPLGEAVVGRLVDLVAAQGVGRDGQPPTLVEAANAVQVARAPHVEKVRVERRACPAERELFAGDVPLERSGPIGPSFLGSEIVCAGRTISAVQPVAVRCVAASQMPSQSREGVWAFGSEMSPSSRTAAALISKRYPVR